MAIIELLNQSLESAGLSEMATLKLAANKWLIDKIVGGVESKDCEEDLQEIEVYIDQGANTSDREEDYLSAQRLAD